MILSKNVDIHVFFITLCAEGARHIKPRATPWGSKPQMRGALKGRDIRGHFARCLLSHVTPFQGLCFFNYFSQGVALG